MRRAFTVVLTLAAFNLALPAAGHAIAADRLMVREINEFRAANGVPRIHRSRSLNRASRSYARRLMARDEFRHARNLRASGRFNALGEVIELHTGSRVDVRRALRAWKQSPGHRAVLLHRSFRYVGAGFAKGSWRGRRATIWVARLGIR